MAHLSNENKLMETIPEKLLDLLDKDFETTVLRMFKEQKKKDKTKKKGKNYVANQQNDINREVEIIKKNRIYEAEKHNNSIEKFTRGAQPQVWAGRRQK